MPVRFACFLATALVLAASTFGAMGPTTLNNDDSCDIALTPAATLLLPYFEVELGNAVGQTTVFAITNVTDVAQVARVTLWTDYAYPVVSFNIYLTGYDVQSINLYDVIARGMIGQRLGTGVWVSPEGDLSGPNRRLDVSECGAIPPRLDPSMMTRMQQAFTLGSIGGICNSVGTVHEYAVGYATIDVVGNCGASGPTDPAYFTEDIRYDNVLIGDYLQVDRLQNLAQGGPMVHIRAIPAGGTPRTRAAQTQYRTRFDRTFYGRFQDPAHRGADARQPLPSTFAARWVNGGAGELETSLKIWRQGILGATADCNAYWQHGLIDVAESVAFDEDENGEGIFYECHFSACVGPYPISLPSTALVRAESGSDIFPQSNFDSTTAGWLYLNLDDRSVYYDSYQGLPGGHQNWVVVSMRAEGKLSVEFDAAWLGNGCSPAMAKTSFSNNGEINNPGPQSPAAILPGPASDVNPPLP